MPSQSAFLFIAKMAEDGLSGNRRCKTLAWLLTDNNRELLLMKEHSQIINKPYRNSQARTVMERRYSIACRLVGV